MPTSRPSLAGRPLSKPYRDTKAPSPHPTRLIHQQASGALPPKRTSSSHGKDGALTRGTRWPSLDTQTLRATHHPTARTQHAQNRQLLGDGAAGAAQGHRKARGKGCGGAFGVMKRFGGS